MKLILQRYSDNRQCTLGLLFSVVNHGGIEQTYFLAYTLEDEYRDEKIKGETRIPAGTYKLGIQKAETPLTLKYRARYPWFRNHIEIQNVPGFTGVYIHIGNRESDTAGCILVADGANNNHVADGEIVNSTNAFKRIYGALYEHIEKGDCTIQIRDEKTLLT